MGKKTQREGKNDETKKYSLWAILYGIFFYLALHPCCTSNTTKVDKDKITNQNPKQRLNYF